jgi:hypothetical protein
MFGQANGNTSAFGKAATFNFGQSMQGSPAAQGAPQTPGQFNFGAKPAQV